MNLDWYVWLEIEDSLGESAVQDENHIPLYPKKITYAPPGDDVMYIVISEHNKHKYHGDLYQIATIGDFYLYFNNAKKSYALYDRNDVVVEELAKRESLYGSEYVLHNSNMPSFTPNDPMYEGICKFLSHLFDKMNYVDAQVGDIWKMPDPLSCILYAITEANEVLESILLQVRSSDSRNNKKAEDFDTATELFDVLMMVLRHYISLHLAIARLRSPNNDTDSIRDGIATFITEHLFEYYGYERNVFPTMVADESTEAQFRSNVNSMYSNEPIGLIAKLTELYQEYKPIHEILVNSRTSENDQVYKHLSARLNARYSKYNTALMEVIDYLVNHPVLLVAGAYQICDAKFDKIYQKSLAKKQRA